MWFPENFAKCLRKPILKKTYELIFLFHCGSRSSHSEVYSKKAVFKNFVKFPEKMESHVDKVAGHRPGNLLENRAQVFFGKFCEISVNIYFVKHLRMTGSVLLRLMIYCKYRKINWSWKTYLNSSTYSKFFTTLKHVTWF